MFAVSMGRAAELNTHQHGNQREDADAATRCSELHAHG